MPVNIPYPLIRSSDLEVDVTGEIYEGSPVAINLKGLIIPATNETPVYGISLIDRNRYRDMTFGDMGAYGSGRLSVAKGNGCELAIVSPNYYFVGPIERVFIEIIDKTVTFLPNDPVGVTPDGKITVVAPDAVSRFATVVHGPLPGRPFLRISLIK